MADVQNSYIDMTIQLDNPLDHGIGMPLFQGITGYRQALASVVMDQGCGLIQEGLAPGGNNQGIVMAAQSQGCGPADARRGPGNQYHFIPVIHTSPHWLIFRLRIQRRPKNIIFRLKNSVLQEKWWNHIGLSDVDEIIRTKSADKLMG